MALRQIVRVGDPVLLKTSRLVTNFDARLHTLLDDMAETMHGANGVGFAAVQVGVLRRVVVIETVQGELHELVNPEIVESSGEQQESEGCLSVPGVWGKVVRPTNVTVKALDRYGKEYTLTGDEMFARAVCHELEHMDGKLFTEFVTEYDEPEDDENDHRRRKKRRK
ncbi:peptide deformylase [Clostridia bacterium]|nr:peptide deformylase [Clostridia bacterium]